MFVQGNFFFVSVFYKKKKWAGGVEILFLKIESGKINKWGTVGFWSFPVSSLCRWMRDGKCWLNALLKRIVFMLEKTKYVHGCRVNILANITLFQYRDRKDMFVIEMQFPHYIVCLLDSTDNSEHKQLYIAPFMHKCSSKCFTKHNS